MSESTWKGAPAELKITTRAIEFGIPVLKPVIEGLRYDLIFDLGTQLLRVQCKWASSRTGVLVIYAATCRLTPRGYVRSTHDQTEIDAIAAYSPETGGCYLVPIADIAGQHVMHLRLQPTANNQEIAVRYAAPYEFGAIAQLGERRAGSAKAGGSSPPSSTLEGPP
jgi:PD-(D/E)XK endonuclease